MRDQVQVGSDFATTPSSPVPCCILFDIASGQLAELDMLVTNRWRRLFHSSLVKLPFVSMSASCFLVSNTSDLDFWVQVDAVKQPIKRNSVGSGNVSHCWTSSFDNHLDHYFIIFKKVEHRTKLRRLHV